MGMRWYSCELSRETSDIFKRYCDKNGIKYESSECFNLIHFQVKLEPERLAEVQEFIDANC